MLELLARDDAVVCEISNDYNGHSGLRILAVFIILISSGLGVYFPILSSRYSFIRLPSWCFFLAKFFGSGVIVSTAFIHLLDPAAEALGNECLGGTFVEYPWAFGICLMSLFLLFFVEIVTHYFVAKSFGDEHHDHGNNINSVHDDDADSSDESITSYTEDHPVILPRRSHNDIENQFQKSNCKLAQSAQNPDDDDDDEEEEDDKLKEEKEREALQDRQNISGNNKNNDNMTRFNSIPGKDHFSHDTDHQDQTQLGTPIEEEDKEQYLNQMFAVFILEFGIIFHSVFVGLSLSVSGEEFETLFIVLTFHQMFEGLGLGTRVAETNWPSNRRYTPWLMGLAFTITSPIAVAIGIGVRHSWIPGSRKALIANGVFDSISSGILIYTGLVELMAHEFLYSNQFKGPDGFKKMLAAYFIMCLGAGLMALLGKWA
ncbi:low-affinity Zn(2+) transporter ZRT2 NDAI_0G02570 [Naumovozyma dairenensis CBS 421]|uniref:Uncharacterized protein n=1 Tax=Naumovozyma dairenensis (strain ATCC 10597 / BCRC 20456 / CBS 421 / NBRC 0211 / NRRL Y-12639) TaxID=1071378 RepID=G0WE23_NAUDC|nr:hypothetical protein NDAI_0G02570 [Naumovozyma dairenensis CBS 421]CCD26034.2 hypothetical protein NDAI_0G02570 [Naumovozyma dairenensis CBS 421]